MAETMYRSKIVRGRIYPEGSDEYKAQLEKPEPKKKKKKKLRTTVQETKTPKRDEYFRPRTHKEFLDFLDAEDAKAREGFKKT